MTPQAIGIEEGGFVYKLFAGGATGSINFDFTGGSLPAGITFTRASIGTYNSSGNILTTASSNVARFNYVAGVANLLIEPSATNILPQSNAFLTSPWSVQQGGVVTAAQFVSPDGTNNGWSLADGGSAGQLAQLTTLNFGTPYTWSLWMKRISGVADQNFVLGDVFVQPVTTTTTLTRTSRTLTPASGTVSSFRIITTNGSINGIYGAQLENGPVMTSYIPTTTAAVTRAADSATFTVPTGINQLVYTFDDNSTQTVAVSPGSYTIPTTLSRPNIKSVVGRYAFDFTSGSLPAGMTFTRPSIGTYTNAGGTLITAGNDVARFNYVAGVSNLLIEPTATNLFPQSNNFSNAVWGTSGGCVVTGAQFVSPDGANNGWSQTSGTANGSVWQSLTYSAIPYTLSAWVKRIIGTAPVHFLVDSNGTGPITTSTTLTRVSGTGPASARTSESYIQIPTTSGNTNGIYGAQIEAGSVMTSYIPTTTTTVTRAADSAVFTIPAGIGHLTYTFDDNSTQLVTVSAGSYTIPTTLNRPNIKSIVGSA